MSAKPQPRVLHIVPALFGAEGVFGGAERYALELARHMADVASTRLLTFGNISTERRHGNLDIRVIGSPWHVSGQPLNPMSMQVFAEIARADVVHCHQQHILVSSLSAAFGAITRRKVFVTDLGGGGWDISSYANTDRWFQGHLHISKYSLQISGHVGNERAHVILGGIDDGKFCPDSSVPRLRHVLFVGRLLPHKGVNYLIEALPHDLSLVVIGQPMDDCYFKDLQELAVGKKVSFYHSCSDADIINAYRSALCVVLPSVYRTVYGNTTVVPELLGQTLLEGMACGTPAICTDVASMPEIVVDGSSGFIVAPNDPAMLRDRLLWLRDHSSEAEQMGVAARRRVLDNFRWPDVVRRCLKIYSQY